MKTADDTSFDETILQADKPVLVDFTAAWCPPCKLLEPILEKFAHDHPELDVILVDADEAPRSSARYGVTAMPTLMLFDRGELKATTLGLQNESRLTNFVTEALT